MSGASGSPEGAKVKPALVEFPFHTPGRFGVPELALVEPTHVGSAEEPKCKGLPCRLSRSASLPLCAHPPPSSSNIVRCFGSK